MKKRKFIFETGIKDLAEAKKDILKLLREYLNESAIADFKGL
jgi:hypothetical protein